MTGQATRPIGGPYGCAMEMAEDDSLGAWLISLVREKQSRRAVLVAALVNAVAIAHLLGNPPGCVLQLVMALA